MLNQIKIVGRQCGECTVCCNIMQIRELDKPLRTDCKHLCNGCSIYEVRPKSCKDFECLWLQGHIGGEIHRPDKLGVMFTASLDDGHYSFHAWEVWEGAMKNEKVRYILNKLAEKIVFTLRCIGKPMALMGKRGMIEKFRKIHKI